MNALRQIRQHLGVTQAELAHELEVSQGNVSFYEKGQTVSPEVAGRLIVYAKGKGLDIGYDHVYGALPLPFATPAELIGSDTQAQPTEAEGQ